MRGLCNFPLAALSSRCPTGYQYDGDHKYSWCTQFPEWTSSAAAVIQIQCYRIFIEHLSMFNFIEYSLNIYQYSILFNFIPTTPAGRCPTFTVLRNPPCRPVAQPHAPCALSPEAEQEQLQLSAFGSAGSDSCGRSCNSHIGLDLLFGGSTRGQLMAPVMVECGGVFFCIFFLTSFFFLLKFLQSHISAHFLVQIFHLHQKTGRNMRFLFIFWLYLC